MRKARHAFFALLNSNNNFHGIRNDNFRATNQNDIVKGKYSNVD